MPTSELNRASASAVLPEIRRFPERSPPKSKESLTAASAIRLVRVSKRRFDPDKQISENSDPLADIEGKVPIKARGSTAIEAGAWITK